MKKCVNVTNTLATADAVVVVTDTADIPANVSANVVSTHAIVSLTAVDTASITAANVSVNTTNVRADTPKNLNAALQRARNESRSWKSTCKN